MEQSDLLSRAGISTADVESIYEPFRHQCTHVPSYFTGDFLRKEAEGKEQDNIEPSA